MFGRILLIDDSEGEALLVQQMLRQAGLQEPVSWIAEPEIALAYLEGSGFYANRQRHPLPEIILLDLAMPRLDGYQLLKWIRDQRAMDRIVVVVLTAETDPKRINLAYQLGANSFLSKQANIEEYRNFVEFFRTFTRAADTLPRPLGSEPATGSPLLVPLEEIPPTQADGTRIA